MLDYRGRIRNRGGGYSLAWVKAENQEDAEDLLYRIYGDVNVARVREMKDLEIYQAEVLFPNGTFVPTEVCAEDETDARRTLRTLYGAREFRLLD